MLCANFASNAMALIWFRGSLREIENKCAAFDALPLMDLPFPFLSALLTALLCINSFLAALHNGNSHSTSR